MLQAKGLGHCAASLCRDVLRWKPSLIASHNAGILLRPVVMSLPGEALAGTLSAEASSAPFVPGEAHGQYPVRSL